VKARVASLCFVLVSMALGGSDEKPATVPSNHLIRIGPSANMMSETGPAYLSVAGGNTIRWVASSHLVIVFPDDGFPLLPDGTRVTEPPFVRMVHQDERWFVRCEAESCRSDT